MSYLDNQTYYGGAPWVEIPTALSLRNQSYYGGAPYVIQPGGVLLYVVFAAGQVRLMASTSTPGWTFRYLRKTLVS